jgi:L,D-peptidoglycan transpeptidase YkuD (ErfK/YbiS/YcfS/YnhG family)
MRRAIGTAEVLEKCSATPLCRRRFLFAFERRPENNLRLSYQGIL